MHKWRIELVLVAVIGVWPVASALWSSPVIIDIPEHSSDGFESAQEVAAKRKKKKAPKKKPAQKPKHAPSPTPPAPSIPPNAPSRVLNLTNWKLTLPVDNAHAGSPDEITQPELAGYVLSPYFWRSGSGVVFRAHAGGATTENSGYPRSELREMTSGGRSRASWSNTSGTHVMTIRQAITHLPAKKPHVVAGQIHDAEDDVIMIRLEGKRLFVEGDGDEIGVLTPNYTLGTAFTVQIVASGGRIYVSYNGALKVNYAKSGSGYYFKAGCYTQTNPSRGDIPTAYGEVVIYSLSVSHT